MRNVNGTPVGLQAHRGVSTDCPENTMAAFRASAEQGYDVIELDPRFTADGYCVVLHDRTLTRTARTADGLPPEEDVHIADITLAEARSYDYGLWFGEAFRGEQLPLLEDALRFARDHHIRIKIDNVAEGYTPAQQDALFDVVETAGAQQVAGFTGTRPDYLARVAARFPGCMLHYDGPVDEARLAEVAAAAAGHPLTVWLPYPNRLTSWCKMPAVSADRAALVRSIGAKLGLWIIEDEADLETVCRLYAPDLVETTGSLKPD